MATEIEVIKYEGDISALRKDLKEIENGFKSTESKAKKTVDNVKGSFNGLGSSIKNALSSLPIGGFVNELENASNSARSLSSGLSSIAPSANKGTSAVGVLANALKVGVLGALTAIIFAFTAVVSFFKQTDEGATRLESIFNGLSSSADVLQGKFAIAGDKIVSFFTESEGAGSGFLSTIGNILTKVSPTIGAIVDLGKAIGSTGLAKELKSAYDEGARLTFELDAINDGIRVLGVESRQTELKIAALLKQTRNTGLDISDRIALVSQAFDLENKNLEKNFELQRRYYENIALTNLQKTKAINSDKEAQVAQVELIVSQIKYAKNANEILSLYQKQIKAQEGLRTIGDDLSQRQADSATKLIELDGKAQVVAEKFATIRSSLINQNITEIIDAIKSKEAAQEAEAINTIKNTEDLSKRAFNIQLNSLNEQRDLYEKFNKDKLLDDNSYAKATSAIDLEIARLKQKYAEDDLKRAKEASDKKLKNDADNAARYKLLVDSENALELQRTTFALKNAEYELTQNKGSINERLALIEKLRLSNEKQAKTERDIALKDKNLTSNEKIKIEEAYAQKIVEINRNAQSQILSEEEKAAQAKKRILDATVDYTDFSANAIQMIANDNFNRDSQRRSDELQASSDLTNKRIEQLRREKESGAITQEQYDARVKKLELAQAKREKQARIEQAKAEKKNALFGILINTSLAVVKAIAESPATFGLPFSAFALATGAVEAALVSSRPLPAYAKGVIDLQGKGTKTSDSITARLSKGESVMTADETSRYKDTLWAIRNNQFDRHINESWVMPAIKKLEKQRSYRESLRDRSMNRLGKQMKAIDLQHLERLTANNKDVRIGNVDQLADAINKKRGHYGLI